MKKIQKKFKFKFLIPGRHKLPNSMLQFEIYLVRTSAVQWFGCPRNHVKTCSDIDVSHAVYQTPEGYISKDIYILSYIQKSPKRIFLSFFGAGYFKDIISYF
jgi:hypothetical protein